MTTEELERVLHDALHAADGAVDVVRARSLLAQRVVQRQARHTARQRRLAVAAVVVAVLSAALTIPQLRGHDGTGPIVANPHRELAPSGLPVGILTTTLDRTPAGGVGTTRLQLVVRADGSGQYRAWDSRSGGDGRSATSVELALSRLAPGRAALLYGDTACPQRSQLTLDFTLGGGRVRILRAQSADCLVSRDLAARLTGSELRVQPLTASERTSSQEVSPSGLPVGRLKAFFEAGTPPVAKYFQLLVRADGTGVFNQGNANSAGDNFDVDVRAAADGKVIVRYESPAPGVCTDHVAFSFTFTKGKSSVLVDQPEAGCLLPSSLASSMKGLVLQLHPIPSPS
jgi:hypothetical protein